MLSFFRRGIMAKVMLGVLFLSLVAIVITGFGTGGMGGLGELAGRLGSDTVASAGGEKIGTERVRDEANRQVERLRQQQPGLDIARFVRGGGFEDVIEQLIDAAAIVAFGDKQGLVVTKRMIDEQIANIPAFQGVTGQFDQNAFRAALAQNRITETQLRDEIRNQLMQKQLVLPAAASAQVPQALATQYASLLLESRTGLVGAVPTKAMGRGADPSEPEIAAWYKQNIGGYTIPERRVIRYAAFGADSVADQAKATDAEIAAAYRQNPAYAARETRTLLQVVLPAEPAARAFAQKVAAGTPFAQAAAQAGFAASDIAIGDKSRDDYARLASPQVAAAVFAAARGATVGPVRSGFGWHIVKVEDVKTVPAKPIEAVRGEIAAAIGRQKAQSVLSDMASRIENSASAGASFADIAKAEKLNVIETPPVTADGLVPNAPPGWTAPPDLGPLLKGAFQMDAGDEPAVETVKPNERYALVSVAQTIAAAAPPLAQIHDRAKIDLMAWRASQRARQIAEAIVARINSGTPPAQVFAAAGIALPPTQPLSGVRRDISRQGAQVPPQLTMLFSLPRGKARLMDAGEARGWFVVYLDKIVPGDAAKAPGLPQMVRSQFGQIFSDEYAQQFTASLRSAITVKRNDAAAAKLKAEMLRSGGAQ
jgi:peptidyl-prolyl cis-trans isomerase D